MIIDSHTHFGRIFTFSMTKKQLLRSMDKYGIDYSLVSDIEAAENDHRGRAVPRILQKSQNRVLRSTIAFARENPDRIGAVPWLKIRQELPDDDFKRMVRDNRDVVFGFKLHPFHSRTAPDDERLEPIYRLAAELELPVVSHTGGCPEAMSPRLYNAAKRHPEIDFVMVHMDLGTDNKTALELLGGLPNLYGDTTWVPIETTVEAIRRWGPEKMIFGTDNPIDGEDTLLHNKTGERSLYRRYFHELRELISGDDYDLLMCENAKRVFKLRLTE